MYLFIHPGFKNSKNTQQQNTWNVLITFMKTSQTYQNTNNKQTLEDCPKANQITIQKSKPLEYKYKT